MGRDRIRREKVGRLVLLWSVWEGNRERLVGDKGREAPGLVRLSAICGDIWIGYLSIWQWCEGSGNVVMSGEVLESWILFVEM